jgi:Tfp pilus assembly protein PilN
MITVNLIKQSTSQKKSLLSKGFKPEYLVGIIVALAVIGVILWYWSLTREISQAEAVKEDLEQQNLQLIALRGELSRYQEQKRQLEDRTRIIEELKATQEGPVNLLNSIIGSIPKDDPKIWLTSMDQEDNSVIIEGQALDVPAIADFVLSLSQRNPFVEVELDFWEEKEQSVSFGLSCTIQNY